MAILNIFKRKRINVNSTYAEIRQAQKDGRITVAVAFGLIQEKNRRSQSNVKSSDHPGS